MKKRIFLCTPITDSYIRDERCQIDINSRVAENMREPVQLLYTTGLLMKEGYGVFLKDYSVEREAEFKDVLYDIKKMAPDYLYVETTQGTFNNDLSFVRVIHEQMPTITVILKSPFLDAQLIERVKDSIPGGTIKIYFIIRDFEESLFSILQERSKDDELENLFCLSNNEILYPKKIRDKQTFNIDLYPNPPRYFLNKYKYVRPDTNKPMAYIYTAKGCPYSCIFCSARDYFGSKIQLRSVSNTVNEIQECIDVYDISDFFFRADSFTYNKQWVLELCEEIQKRNLKIRWGVNSRIDNSDEEMFLQMKKAGCEIVGFGVESGSDYILKKIGKGITCHQIKAAHHIAQKVGLKSFFHFIIGFPWDTKETIHATKRFILDLNPDFIEVNVPYPLRGTALFTIAEESDLFVSHEYEKYSHVKPILRTFTLSESMIEQYRKDLLRCFYIRGSYIFNTLRKTKSLGIAKNYIKWGIKCVIKLI